MNTFAANRSTKAAMQGINRSEAPKPQKHIGITIPEVQTAYLDNGVKVLTLQSATADVTKIDVVLQAGTWHQPQVLLARTVNDMLSEGTKHYSSAQLAEKLDYHGAYLRQEVDRHHAIVGGLCLSAHTEVLLEIIAELIQHAVFPEAEFEQLRAKGKQNLRVALEKTNRIAGRDFNHLLFGENHPYGTLAQPEDWSKLSIEQLQRFYRTYYRAQGAYILVSGNVPADIITMLNRFLGQGDWQTDAADAKMLDFEPTEELNQYSGRRLFVRKANAQQSSLVVGKLTPNRLHPDYLPLSLAVTALGGYFGSRLMRSLREDKGYTYGVHASLDSQLKTGAFSITTDVGVAHTVAAAESIYYELERLCTEPLEPSELELVKTYMAGSLLRLFDGPFAMPDLLIDLQAYELSLDYYQQQLDSLQAIDAQEIQRVAQAYLKPDEMSEVVVGQLRIPKQESE